VRKWCNDWALSNPTCAIAGSDLRLTSLMSPRCICLNASKLLTSGNSDRYHWQYSSINGRWVQFAAQPYSKLRFHGFYQLLLTQSDKRALVGYSVALEPKLHLRLESPWCKGFNEVKDDSIRVILEIYSCSNEIMRV